MPLASLVHCKKNGWSLTHSCCVEVIHGPSSLMATAVAKKYHMAKKSISESLFMDAVTHSILHACVCVAFV